GFSGREGVLIKEGESEEDYRKALQADFAQAKAQLEENTGKEMIALAFPYGYYSDIALEEAKNSGVKITFAADHGGNYIVSGDPESLHLLLRINVFDTFSGEMLLRKIKDAERATPMPEIPVEESTEESETEEE
ncbi:MAG: polysaccharide deacetylase family protein, partial [Firmicutes bacterium]|nr:polysaccharide deacetylase family protein [Bacillota bacterium]